MEPRLNNTSTCSHTVNFGKLYCGPLTYPIQMGIALSLLMTLVIFITGLSCIQKEQPQQIAAYLEILNARERERAERAAQNREIVPDTRVPGTEGRPALGQFPAPGAPRLSEIQGQRHSDNLSDSSTVRAIALGGLFAGVPAPGRGSLNSDQIDGIEMDDLRDRRRDGGGDEGLRGW